MPLNSDGYPTPGWGLEPRLTWYDGGAIWLEEIACEEHARYEAVVRRAYAKLNRASDDFASQYPDEPALTTGSGHGHEVASAFERDADVLETLADSGEFPSNPGQAIDRLQHEIRFQKRWSVEAANKAHGEPTAMQTRLNELAKKWEMESRVETAGGVGERKYYALQVEIYETLLRELNAMKDRWQVL